MGGRGARELVEGEPLRRDRPLPVASGLEQFAAVNGVERAWAGPLFGRGYASAIPASDHSRLRGRLRVHVSASCGGVVFDRDHARRTGRPDRCPGMAGLPQLGVEVRQRDLEHVWGRFRSARTRWRPGRVPAESQARLVGRRGAVGRRVRPSDLRSRCMLFDTRSRQGCDGPEPTWSTSRICTGTRTRGRR